MKATSIEQTLSAELAERREQNLYRERQILEGPQGTQVCIAGKTYLNFSSNDYLGLAAHPDVIAAFRQGAVDYGVGSGAAHLISGHTRAHHALEEELADFVGRPRALLFSTGYMANLGIATALTGRGDAVFEDRLNHASLLDAGLLSGARFTRYAHGDAQALAQKLQASKARRKLVLTDGVFSMDGDIAPLPQLAQTCRDHNAWLVLDDAHSFGVLGQGKGTAAHYSMGPDDVPILMGTLGKALGVAGAFVAGSEALIETLIQHARTYIYTTAMPAALAQAARASLHIVREDSTRLNTLNSLIAYFKQRAAQLGLPLVPSDTPIQPIMVGDAARALAISDQLRENGLLVTAIRPPTVPAGSSRLRVTLSAAHSKVQIDRLLRGLEEVFRQD
ncbi:MAG TPA: 8-amino-7-oxononanoate synthase [Gammaproteobacteria bacterium]|nr:8-amino-7-oxononanoate synthase [Gammaproteobacteria bacterium]